MVLALCGCLEPDHRLGGWDRGAQASALEDRPGAWSWRHRGYLEKWAVIGGRDNHVRSAALDRIASIGDADACRFLIGELDGPNGPDAEGAMQEAGIDDDCARIAGR